MDQNELIILTGLTWELSSIILATMPSNPVNSSQKTPIDTSTDDSAKSRTQSSQVSQNPQQPIDAALASQTFPGAEGESKKPFPKKIILIVVAVLILLLVAAAGAYYYFWILKDKKVAVETAEPSPLARATLILDSPADQQATTSAEILVSGKTNPSSVVSAYSENFSEIYESDISGKFSGTFVLDEGPNEITFVAQGDNSRDQSETRSVVYVKGEEL